jgi:hypothetical protein
MIVNINAWPGVGKLSVAELLHRRIGGYLLENHAIYNVAFGLCAFGSVEFYDTVRAVQRIAFARAGDIGPDVPIILTSAYAETPFGRENWAAIRALADHRRAPLCNVVLECALEENVRRLRSTGRQRRHKLVDPDPLIAMKKGTKIIADGGDHLLRFETTTLTAERCSERIFEWLKKVGLMRGEPST